MMSEMVPSRGGGRTKKDIRVPGSCGLNTLPSGRPTTPAQRRGIYLWRYARFWPNPAEDFAVVALGFFLVGSGIWPGQGTLTWQ